MDWTSKLWYASPSEGRLLVLHNLSRASKYVAGYGGGPFLSSWVLIQ